MSVREAIVAVCYAVKAAPRPKDPGRPAAASNGRQIAPESAADDETKGRRET